MGPMTNGQRFAITAEQLHKDVEVHTGDVPAAESLRAVQPVSQLLLRLPSGVAVHTDHLSADTGDHGRASHRRTRHHRHQRLLR